MSEIIPIAKIGRKNGLKGWCKLIYLTDFPEQFKKGNHYKTETTTLEIEFFDQSRNLVKFVSYDTPEKIQMLTGQHLFTTIEETKKQCVLKENEFFWFDIIGCEIVEEGRVLGRVSDINRINDINYIVVETDSTLCDEGLPKRFLFDFKQHKQEVDLEKKIIYTADTFVILESS